MKEKERGKDETGKKKDWKKKEWKKSSNAGIEPATSQSANTKKVLL